jgi:hypothetical protein
MELGLPLFFYPNPDLFMPSRYLILLTEIERIFDFFNERCCEGGLKKPFILLNPSTNGMPSMGWFGVSNWKDEKAEEIYEINLCPDHMKGRNPYGIVETLIHEMAHLKNHQEGIVDIDPNTQFHFETYKATAELFGLEVAYGEKGWAYTQLGQRALELIVDCEVNLEAFGIYLVDQN